MNHQDSRSLTPSLFQHSLLFFSLQLTVNSSIDQRQPGSPFNSAHLTFYGHITLSTQSSHNREVCLGLKTRPDGGRRTTTTCFGSDGAPSFLLPSPLSTLHSIGHRQSLLFTHGNLLCYCYCYCYCSRTR